MVISRRKLVIVIFIILLLTAVAFIISKQLKPSQKTQPSSINTNAEVKKDSINAEPQIISTKPDPLQDTIVSATEIIEITFNRPLENVGEFKSRIEPKIDYEVELSSDRKTAKIIPNKPYSLGTTYTLFIGPDSKFDGVGNWGKDKTFHFRTIKYTGV